MNRAGDRGNRQQQHGRRNEPTLPQDVKLRTFYEGETLKADLYFELPSKVAACFRSAGVSQAALRAVYQGIAGFSRHLMRDIDRGKEIPFEQLRVELGRVYAQRVVRQAKRGVLNDIVKQFIDAHKDVVLSSPKEMAGFYEYFTSVMCYFAQRAS